MFASFLCEGGQISKEQMQEVLHQKNSEKLLLGQLAMDIGLMDEDQIQEVLHLQSSSTARFGELAISKGFLDEEQLAILLKVQSKDDLVTIKILTENFIMEIDVVLEQFEEFKKHYQLSDDDFDAIVDHNMRVCVAKIGRIGASFGFLAEYSALFVGLLSRFIDRDVLLDPACVETGFTADRVILQSCKGDQPVLMGFTAAEDTLAQWAWEYGKITTDGLDEDAVDALQELLNCVVGMFSAVMEVERKLDVHLEVPRYATNVSFEKVFVLPVNTKFGEAKIIMVER